MNKFEKLTKKIKDINGFEKFNPVQSKAIREEYKNENIVCSAPTSSGKTLIAECYALNKIINERRRVIYLAPLKALTEEHSNSFKEKYAKEFDIKVARSTGDLDSSSKYLENNHIIFMTYEKLDSLIRHKASWLSSVGLLIVDEIHMLDSNRGPILESTIVQMRLLSSNIQIIGLSATIPNANEISNWLDAKLIYSEYRPVKLSRGIMREDKIIFEDTSEKKIDLVTSQIESLVLDTLSKYKQTLLFANTRKSAEASAKRLGNITKRFLTSKDIREIEKIKKTLDFETLTDFDKNIFKLIERGSAPHHAGLRLKFRTIIEELFKIRAIKAICATPTLSAGINTPAYRVLIQSLMRYTSSGMAYIGVNEYLQMAGRAGRAGYDKIGEAIIFAKDDAEFERLQGKYIYGEPEEIYSQLGLIPTLRMMLLGLIANGVVFNDKSLEMFFTKTFYANQYKDYNSIAGKIYKILNELTNYKFVEIKNGDIFATRLGDRVAKLYIDPKSAYDIVQRITKVQSMDYNELLMLACEATEMRPYFRPPKSKYDDILQKLEFEYKDLSIPPTQIATDYEIVEKYYTYKILNDWIDEVPEQDIIDMYGVLPGILQSKLSITNWIVYSTKEIARILDLKEIIVKSDKLEKRVKYGIKDELLILASMPNIGRQRARKMHNAGIRNPIDLREFDSQRLANIIGPKVTKKLLDHLKIPHNLNPKELVQKKLF